MKTVAVYIFLGWAIVSVDAGFFLFGGSIDKEGSAPVSLLDQIGVLLFFADFPMILIKTGIGYLLLPLASMVLYTPVPELLQHASPTSIFFANLLADIIIYAALAPIFHLLIFMPARWMLGQLFKARAQLHA